MKKNDELERGVLARVTEDEPLFVLRGRDILAPEAIRDWAHRAYHRGVNMPKIEEARQLADEMEAWQLKYGGKVPD